MLPALHSLQPSYPNHKATVLPPISHLLEATYPSHYSSQTLQPQHQPLQLHHRSAQQTTCAFPLLDRLRTSAMDSHVPSPISPNRMDGTPTAVLHSAASSTSSTPSLCSDDVSARSIPFISNKVLPTPNSFVSNPSDSTLVCQQPVLQQHQSTFQPPAFQQQHTHQLFNSFTVQQQSKPAPTRPSTHRTTPKVHAPLSDRARLAYFQLANLSSLVNLTLLSPVLKPPTSTSPIPPLLVNSRRHLALRSFCERIFLSTRLSPPVVILALRYVHRLVMRASATSAAPCYFPSTLPTGLKLSPRALLIVSLLLANKFLEDQRYSNATWARLGGLPLEEINRAERECLAALAYDLTVSEAEYAAWLKELEGIVDAAKRTQPGASAAAAAAAPVVVSDANAIDKHALLSQLLTKTDGQNVTELLEDNEAAERVKQQLQHHARVMARTKMWVAQQQLAAISAANSALPSMVCGGKAVGKARDGRVGYMPY
ncbi:hypothetical protein BJ742DRAFT_72071 [Cladochytrium replicatum]|nr:hypothetical protein BJ742DRAFT_72071 [Cladochytrium replicatum]